MNDILLSDINDLTFSDGDFAVGESAAQEIENIIIASPGNWFEFPLVGCSVYNYIASPGDGEALRNSIQQQLLTDGKQVSDYSYSFNAEGQLVININGITITLG